jgi:hypothetical protein
MVTNPKPKVSIWPSDCEGAIVQRDASRPDFLTLALSDFLELQGRMLLVGFEQ